MLLGYIYNSLGRDDTDLKEKMIEQGIKSLYRDKKKERPDRDRMIQDAKRGDYILIQDFSHLGESISQVQELVKALYRVKIYFLTIDGWNTKKNPSIDLSDLDRKIRWRQKEEIKKELNKISRRRRKRKIDNDKRVVVVKDVNNKSHEELRYMFDCSYKTIQRSINRYFKAQDLKAQLVRL